MTEGKPQKSVRLVTEYVSENHTLQMGPGVLDPADVKLLSIRNESKGDWTAFLISEKPVVIFWMVVYSVKNMWTSVTPYEPSGGIYYPDEKRC
jgi:hypothetical protein